MRQRVKYRGERMAVGQTVSPTQSQRDEIARLAAALGIDPPRPATETEARFVVDDLMALERRQRRAAQRAER